MDRIEGRKDWAPSQLSVREMQERLQGVESSLGIDVPGNAGATPADSKGLAAMQKKLVDIENRQLQIEIQLIRYERVAQEWQTFQVEREARRGR